MLLHKVRGLLTKRLVLCSLLLFIFVSMTTHWRTPTKVLDGLNIPRMVVASRQGTNTTKDQMNLLNISNGPHDDTSKRYVIKTMKSIGEPATNSQIKAQTSPSLQRSPGKEDVDHDATKNRSQGGMAAGGQRKMFQYLYATMTSPSNSEYKSPYKVTNNATDSGPRILCWILTDPSDLERRTKHVKATWAERCDITLYMSSTQNESFPTVGLKVLPGRNHIAAKAKAAWRYIHKHYLDKADFFMKADPDTYVIVENLKEYLQDQDSEKPVYYGHRFYQAKWGYTYMSGGAGLVLTRESVRRLVEESLPRKPDCMPDGQGEDWKTAKCLTLAGATSVDTRDSAGRERFLVFNPSAHVRGIYPEWYAKRDPDGALKGKNCCSNYPISFHYIKPDEMYVLDYFFYRARPHGKELVTL